MTTPNAPPSHGPVGQERIWSHFQNEGRASFDAARPRLDFLIRQIARKCPGATPAVLNIGAGNGYLELTAATRGWAIQSLDPDSRAIAKLAAQGIAARQGYIENLPHADAAFDCVVASEVLEHLSVNQREQGLKDIARVLKPAGWFLGTVPYNENLAEGQVVCPCCGALFHRWGHQATFDEPVMRRLLSSRFDVSELRHTAFVDWRGRSLAGKLKGLARVCLAQCGAAIAVPTLYFAARKRV